MSRHDPAKIRLSDPSREGRLDDVRALMRAFVRWHRDRHPEDLELIDAYFDGNAFEEELASLPGQYARPHGTLLLALVDREPAGCVALKRIDPQRCEMKRMFVYPRFHGLGVGKALALAVIEEARSLGFSRMLLDTSRRQVEAQRLYSRMGFREIEPYYVMPAAQRDWLVFMEMEL